MDEALLQRLVMAHSTPGDEAEVRGVLEACWRASGWRVERHGDYAVSAGLPEAEDARPVLLICAHMDSPGYSVDRLAVQSGVAGRAAFGVTELGSPEFGGGRAAAVLKCGDRRVNGFLVAAEEDGETDCRFEAAAGEAEQAGVRHGDRVCFAAVCETEGTLFTAPFLDNRLGCWMLARLAEEAPGWRTGYRIVLGATGSEEMGGFGARVLAAQVRPDLAVVLDTTYESEEQGVRLGQGPVLTLSDASVLVSPGERDRVLERMAQAGVPLQTEAYNFSGTDARAFPQQGLACPVYSILIPTRGNHAPLETADTRDGEAWLAAVRVIAENF